MMTLSSLNARPAGGAGESAGAPHLAAAAPPSASQPTPPTTLTVGIGAAAPAAAAAPIGGGDSGGAALWEVCTDESDGCVFYFNTRTGESQWEAPPGL